MSITYVNGWANDALDFPLLLIDIGHGYPMVNGQRIHSYRAVVGIFGFGIGILLEYGK